MIKARCDEEGILKATTATCEDLVALFYRNNDEMIAPQQYEEAKKDFEYFLKLIDLAVAYFDAGMKHQDRFNRRLISEPHQRFTWESLWMITPI